MGFGNHRWFTSRPCRFVPDNVVWDEVASDTGNCLRRACKFHKQCFYFRARRRAEGAQLLIVNHAMFFSDLALRRLGVSLLPDYDTVILDESHTVESVAGDHLGIRLSSGQFDYLFNQLYNDRTQKGLLVEKDLKGLQQQVDQCRYAATLCSPTCWTGGMVEGPITVECKILESSKTHLANPWKNLPRRSNARLTHKTTKLIAKTLNQPLTACCCWPAECGNG